MCLIVFPAQTLGDAQAAPLLLEQNPQRARLGIEVVAGDGLEHVFGQHDVAVLVRVVAVPRAVVDGLLELFQPRPF